MTTEEAVKVLKILRKESRGWNLPWVEVERSNRDPFQVLISCILSLRTKDPVTAQASKRLFAHASTPEKMLNLKVEEIEKLIYPVGFYRVKARNIKEICKILLQRYEGKVPDSIEELLKLKGVGRKTATLVLSLGYGKPAICVDTHVHRIANRWGLVETKNPHQTEVELRKKIPVSYWRIINSLLVAFGQLICKPISPLCSRCPVEVYCSKIGVVRRR